MSDTEVSGETDTGEIQGLADTFPETAAYVYRSGILDRDLPVFTTCSTDILQYVGDKSAVNQCKVMQDDATSGSETSDSSDGHTSAGEFFVEFTPVDQYFYNARRLEAEVALYDLSKGLLQSEVPSTRPSVLEAEVALYDLSKGLLRSEVPSIRPSVEKEHSRNVERRRKQRERQKERKKASTLVKSPPPVETNVPPVKTKSKDEKPDKSQKGSNKAKKPTAGTAPSRDVKAGEEKGRKSPKLVPGSSGSGRKSPGLSIPENPTDDYSKLEKDFIFPLKKKSLKFPRAKFFCRLCDYHCDDTGHVNKHIKDNRHQAIKKVKVQDVLLVQLPPPTTAHTEVVTRLLQKVTKEHVLTKSDLDSRNAVLQRLRKLVNNHFTDVQLNMYGSSVSGFGLKGLSDLNIELTAERAPPVLKELYTILKADKSGFFTRVESDFSDTVPCIRCHVPSLHLFVQIGIPGTGTTSGSSWLVGEMLRVYTQIDPRVKLLGVPFRRWAHLCGIDRQENGTLPAYAFSLLLVFFLQQCEPPVLPVLHEIGSPEDRQGGAQSNLYFNDLQNLSKFWRCANTDSLGALWIKLCRFYAVDFDVREKVVCLRQQEAVSRGDKKWTRRLPIEDPFQRKRNVARSISHIQVFDYISEQMRNLYQYFGIPQTPSGPLFKDIDISVLEKELANSMRDHSPRKSPTQSPVPGDQDSEKKSKLPEKSASQELLGESDNEGDALISDSGVNSVYSFAASIAKSAISAGMRESVEGKEALKKVHEKEKVTLFDCELSKGLKVEDLHFVFSKDVFCKEKGPPRICALCHKQTHLQQDCPDVKLPPLTPLPPLNKRYMSMLDKILFKVPQDFEPTKLETDLRSNLRGSLEQYIRQVYRDARLYLFGSSCNGFGFSHSDMDICMVLETTDSTSVDYVEVILSLAKHLRKHSSLQNVLAITTAKVPIVKFKHKHSGLDGDISLYNTLAVHNTRMLEMYCKMDYRVRALGYTMKVFAKLCDICDASKGSLSSYAYILMVIYFLQQRSPPVIPVLQELHNGKKPLREVDGWNAWFYDDLASVPTVWSHAGKNKESLGELWIGLLRFYTEEFSYKDFVISIRQKELLTRFEKLWNGKCLAIEDPFDLSHNLGGGLSRKMDNYIMKAFYNGRALFGRSVLEVPRGYSTLEDYLFDPKLLTETAPPNDRNCRICNKIGHWAKECPTVKSRKDKHVEEGKSGKENKVVSSANGGSKTDKNGGKSAQNKEPVIVSKKGNAQIQEAKAAMSRGGNSSEKKSFAKERTSSENDSQPKATAKKNTAKDRKDGQKGSEGNGHAGKDGGKTRQDRQQMNGKTKQSEKSNKRKLNGAAKTVSGGSKAGGVKDRSSDDSGSQKQKARVFYNKQRGAAAGPGLLPNPGLLPTPGLLTPPDQHPSEPVKVTPRAVYINHASSVQISPHDVSPPVQQFFMNYGNPKQSPQPLMDIRFPQSVVSGHHGYHPPQYGPMSSQPQAGSLDNGGGLTWQQTSMLQQATSVQPAKSRGRRTKSENQAEDFPMLEVTIANEGFTWQQQQRYLHSKNQARKGQGRQRRKKASSTRESLADDHMINEQD